ncbi:uncharacterized protein si:cabz01007807.1 isoform X1 [Astyanax mexicanus]|uniref:uncharacterized protein si:cabz01007807.1 isoform X1 n=1 Tax=Astyanax mexicanus TaxID=7994 RepID=UPI0020CAE353|nr:uncharacterized protein si:cabz01007807.1 isoform X1 [Astyanax mexicanus]
MAGEVRAGGQGEAGASGESRPSITQRPGVLRRVTVSPFHSRYKALLSSSSGSGSSPAAGFKQESDFLIHLSDKTPPSGDTPTQNGIISKTLNSFSFTPPNKANGLNGSSTTVDPFSPQGKENMAVPNGRGTNGWPSASSPETPSTPNNWAVFPPSPALDQVSDPFQATPPSWLSDAPKSWSTNHTKDILQPSKANEENGISRSMVSNGVQAASTSYSSDPFQATPPSWLSDVPKIGPSNQTTDIFQSSKANEQNGSSKSMVTNGVQAASTSYLSDPFQATPPSWLSDVPKIGSTNHTKDIFQSSKANEENRISRSVMVNKLQDTSTNSKSDLFEATPPSWLSDVPKIEPTNHTKDIFQSLKAIKENGISRSMVTNGVQAAFTSYSSDPFQATPPSWLSDVPKIEPANHTEDIFQSSTANEKNGVSKSMVAKEASNERDYLLEYILANQKHEDPQPSPPSTVASDGSSSFFPPPVITEDSIFSTPFSTAENGIFQSTPLFQTPTFDPFSDDPAVNGDLFKPQKSPFDDLFATPAGNPNANTPETFQENSSGVSPVNGGLMFRRRPPVPAPRRPLKKPSQTVENQSLSKTAPSDPPQTPVIHLQSPPTSPVAPPTASPFSTTSTKNLAPAEEENNNQVYEDVLLIGQEKCVEDWPEDSPELSSDWKPAGKLRLRRDSVKVTTETEETLGRKHGISKLSKRFSIISRRGSKEKFGDELKVAQTATLGREAAEKRTPDSVNGGYGGTLPWGTKFPEGASDDVFSSDPDEHNVSGTSKPVKQKKKGRIVVPRLSYRTSKIKSPNAVYENGSAGSSLLHGSKDGLLAEASELQGGEKVRNGEVMKEPEMKDCRPKQPMKLKPSVPQRPSKSVFEENQKKMNDFPFSEESKEDTFMKTNAERSPFSTDLLDSSLKEPEGATGFTPSWESQVGYQDDQYSPGDVDQFTTSLENRLEVQDSRPKKPLKLRFPRLPRRGSKSTTDEIPQKGADLFKASDAWSSDLNSPDGYSEHRKPPILVVPPLSRRDSVGMRESETPDTGADLFKAEDYTDAENYMEEYSPDSKPHKSTKSHPASRDAKARDEATFPEDLDPPGATSGNYFLSEAAKAEWMSSQMDVRRSRDPDEEERLEGVEEEEEGDTDSLMEWWNTVELWDELPSDEDISLKEDETKSFTEIAGKVHRGLRVFYKVFTEQAEVLYQHVLLLYAIADDLSNFHRRAKIANITGGTTTAVGGVAAIAGLALAPVTFGASLIVSAVGLGVATAGGITAASAAISDNVHDMNDRKKIELVVQDYETHLTELQSCLRFISEGIRRLRCHPLLRRNNYYAGDWEVRRALQTVSLVSEPVERAEDIVANAMAALNSVCKGMDKYFTKDSRELRKGCKKEVTMRVRMLAKQLHEGLVELNSIREQLLDASGNI